MKRSRFSDEQIIGILKEHQAGLSATGLGGGTAGLSLPIDRALHRHNRKAVPSKTRPERNGIWLDGADK